MVCYTAFAYYFLVIYKGIFMPYFATIYIHPMQGNIPHAFLGLTHKHPDELDLQDEKAKQKSLKMRIGKILIKGGMTKYILAF